MVSNISEIDGDESNQGIPLPIEPAAEVHPDSTPANVPAQPDTTVEAAQPPVTDSQLDAPATYAEDDALVSDAPAADHAVGEGSDDSMHELLEQHPGEPGVKKGEILEGTIVSTSAMEIVVDLGLQFEGVIQSKELERMDKETLEALQVGEKVLVYVISQDAKTGQIILSLQRAQEERDWREAEALLKTGEIFGGKVDGYNKGGLIVRYGRVRGFVPESQVSRDRRRRTEGAADPNNKWASMRGEDISVKVLEVDRARNRLILSERDAAPLAREAQKVRLLDELQVGDIKMGRVKSVADFGVFVDVGGADGLVHLTELSWKHIAKPSEVFKVGQEVKVEVISVDRDRKRIGLSIKRQEDDPWTTVTKAYGIGQLVQGQVTKLTKFGAFARLVDAPEIEGLIHISELADHRVNHPKDVVNEGDTLTLRVVKVDQVERRLGLSLKRVDSPDYLEADYRRATRPAEAMNDIADFEAAAYREEERRRDRKKPGEVKKGTGAPVNNPPSGKGGGKKGGRGGEFDNDFDDDF